MGNKLARKNTQIHSRIITIRGKQVMLDSEISRLYGVEPKRLNEQVKRNKERFPPEFMFQLTVEEWENLRSQFATSSSGYGGRRYLPYVFTEQGVAMLSAVLKSETAVAVSIQIMQAFVEYRKVLSSTGNLLSRVEDLEVRQSIVDGKLGKVMEALDFRGGTPSQGIFYDGQIFDAYLFFSKLVRSAKHSIILIDGYVDENTLMLLSKRRTGVNAIIYTNKVSVQLAADIKKFSEQYEPIEIRSIKSIHDRFVIIDRKQLYHIGASVKDLGKKLFGFSRMDGQVDLILAKLPEVGHE